MTRIHWTEMSLGGCEHWASLPQPTHVTACLVPARPRDDGLGQNQADRPQTVARKKKKISAAAR